ncbi:MAG TPA: hypothetical protein V6C78_01660 [Crinalium sp.]|jgi:hypothetical protein
MTSELTSAHASDFRATLQQAADVFRGIGERPTAEAVVEALLQAEKIAKQQRLTYPFEGLSGRWRLCFATGTRKARQRGGILLGKGFYVPKLASAFISFQPQSDSTGEIGNQAQVGAMRLTLTGPCRYLGKKNLLAFDFTRLNISVFKRILYAGNIRGGKTPEQEFEQKAIAQLPFFAFFLITNTLIAARGRGGGLALWIREI